ncbi:anti-sigma-B factor antagonist [bacterium BMS3Abin05]|nr:anti-sigma-B factor antagonist [bacterium BMS3Abin05]GBE27224.1 anti-sigma-B factor antagonist [bacterium BMS3Bbin03]HDK36443.1 anti-sigma factor antagonist [Bacteroidota bacterium]HDL78267.1 anti-sigma factor antagonist [Bacteroidota bacterium]HDZ13200.1 anti-sigma factor antagonist [Bacteroidota bacterium]
MQIKEEIRGNVAVLFLKGNLMGGPEGMKVHEKIKSLLTDKLKNIVIDLSKVKWMNSSGLGILMACLTSVQKAGGNLKISGTTDKIKNLFMITKLITIFETYENVDRAVARFQTDQTN